MAAKGLRIHEINIYTQRHGITLPLEGALE